MDSKKEVHFHMQNAFFQKEKESNIDSYFAIFEDNAIFIIFLCDLRPTK